MRTSIIGYPRIGAQRDLKFAIEKYFKKETTGEKLEETACALRARHWRQVAAAGIDFIPSNDFSFYDTFLDAADFFKSQNILVKITLRKFFQDFNFISLGSYNFRV